MNYKTYICSRCKEKFTVNAGSQAKIAIQYYEPTSLLPVMEFHTVCNKCVKEASELINNFLHEKKLKGVGVIKC